MGECKIACSSDIVNCTVTRQIVFVLVSNRNQYRSHSHDVSLIWTNMMNPHAILHQVEFEDCRINKITHTHTHTHTHTRATVEACKAAKRKQFYFKWLISLGVPRAALLTLVDTIPTYSSTLPPLTPHLLLSSHTPLLCKHTTHHCTHTHTHTSHSYSHKV